MDNETKKQKYYIYENIDKFKDNNQIINLIKMKKCKFTENGNGIFLNISTLEPDVINIIYQILMNMVDYKEEQHEEKFMSDFNCNTEILSNEGESEENTVRDQPFSLEELLLNNYSKKEQEIITYSKKYNL